MSAYDWQFPENYFRAADNNKTDGGEDRDGGKGEEKRDGIFWTSSSILLSLIQSDMFLCKPLPV